MHDSTEHSRTWPADWPKVDDDLQRQAWGRLHRWQLRKEHRERGGKVLTTVQLGHLIEETQLRAMTAEDPMVLATILLRLDDQQREYDWRAFLGENITSWPDIPDWR